MNDWLNHLHYDPIAPLLTSPYPVIQYFARRDLCGEEVEPIAEIWGLPEVQKLLKKQQADGSWAYRGVKKDVYPPHHYSLVETWRQFRVLVDQYAFTRDHPAGAAAAEFLFSCQTDEGDIRGMIANQYATYYTGAMLSLLIMAGYEDDARVEKGMQWLLAMRQDDGAWSVPILTIKLSGSEQYRLTSAYAEPIQPDRTKPFSHNCTGMVLRAFAAHPRYRLSDEARAAAELLKTRFFQPDSYTSYHASDYWVKFDFPFWWNHLVAALDSISMIAPSRDEAIQQALDWLIAHQGADGLWRTAYSLADDASKETTDRMVEKTQEKAQWISLAICRVLQRFFA